MEPTVDEVKKVDTPPVQTVRIEQDPLPEPSFLARRWLTWALSFAFYGLLLWSLHKVTPEDVLPFAQGVMMLLALVMFFYYAGASTSDIVGVIQAAKLRLSFGRKANGTDPGSSGDDQSSQGR